MSDAAIVFKIFKLINPSLTDKLGTEYHIYYSLDEIDSPGGHVMKMG